VNEENIPKCHMLIDVNIKHSDMPVVQDLSVRHAFLT
jgi:hypothetical protein